MSQTVPESARGAELGAAVTLPSAAPAKVVKDWPKKHWFFTLGVSYMKREELHKTLCQLCQVFVYQIERGEEDGYIHYQGAMTLENKLRMSTLKNRICKQIHLEPTRDTIKAQKYCAKEETRVEGPWTKGLPKPITVIEELRPWQKEIEDIVKGEPDDRTIHWYWEETGGVGKTALAKYLCVKYKAMYVNGKTSDILYAASENPDADVYIINIARDDYSEPYKTLETLKDGIWFSGKYESKMTVRNPPHIIVFANRPPFEGRLSEDRLRVRKI